jgi:hypothetical protein
MGNMIDEIWTGKTSDPLGADRVLRRDLDPVRRSPYRPAADWKAAMKRPDRRPRSITCSAVQLPPCISGGNHRSGATWRTSSELKGRPSRPSATRATARRFPWGGRSCRRRWLLRTAARSPCYRPEPLADLAPSDDGPDLRAFLNEECARYPEDVEDCLNYSSDEAPRRDGGIPRGAGAPHRALRRPSRRVREVRALRACHIPSVEIGLRARLGDCDFVGMYLHYGLS